MVIHKNVFVLKRQKLKYSKGNVMMPEHNFQMVQEKIIYGEGEGGRQRRARGRGEREGRALRTGTISASTMPITLNKCRGIRIQHHSQSPCTP